jgi:hypothetical protein
MKNPSVLVLSADALSAFEPRKTPVQLRATVTVEAISEATIQVLLSRGFRRRAVEGRQNRSSILEANPMDEKTKETTDQPVLGHIERLVAEEHKLYNHATLGEEDRARLAKIKVELDQCWDLLRQRRARREFGQDPKAAHCAGPMW